MRLVAMVVTGVLAIAVIAEGAYIFHTRDRLQMLERRLEALSAEPDTTFVRLKPNRRSGGDREDTELDADRGAPSPPPRFNRPPGGREAPAPGDPQNPLPLPAALDSAEAREQLRQFVAAQLERERQEARDRVVERRTERETRWREQVTKQLALSPPEAEKFNQILNNSQNRRDALQARIQAGELEGPAIRSAVVGLREESSRELRALLGEERAAKYEELRRSEGRSGPGGGGFGRFGGGPPGSGPAGGPIIP
jgi:hypothetical protein